MSDNHKEQAPWWQPGLILFFELSSWIVAPILLSILLGKYLDRRFNTEPWIFLGLTALAFVISTFAIIFLYSREVKKIEDKAESDKLRKAFDANNTNNHDSN